MSSNIENITRTLGSPSYEYAQFWAALGIGTFYLLESNLLAAPELAKAIGTAFLGYSLCRFRPSIERKRMEKRWLGLRSSTVLITELTKKLGEKTSFLGKGFFWEQPQRQGMYEINKLAWNSLRTQLFVTSQALPFFCSHLKENKMNVSKTHHKFKEHCHDKISKTAGSYLQALGEEKDVYISNDEARGHTLIVGGSGTGKTVLMSLIAAQKIMQGDTVIVLDPKADAKHGLEKILRRTCELAGRAQDFVSFDLAQPERSARLNLMANFKRPMDLASRICATIKTTGDGEAFVKYGHGAIAIVCWALDALGERPTFKLIYHYLLNRLELAVRVFKQHVAGLEANEVPHFLDSIKNVKPEAQFHQLVDFCKEHSTLPTEFDALIRLVEDPDDHYNKMIPSVLEQLEVMTMGSIGDMFSPPLNAEKAANQIFWDSSMFVDKHSVVYMNLDSTGDIRAANTVGSMVLSDMTAVASDKLNFETKRKNISLLVDEASEIVCEPFVQLLNKGRAAGFSIVLATQTINDFVSKTGDRADAMRILANLNLQIAFACKDPETQDFISKQATMTVLRMKQEQQGVTTTDKLAAQTGTTGERFSEAEVELLPPQILSTLPPLEYFLIRKGSVTKGRCPIVKFDDEE